VAVAPSNSGYTLIERMAGLPAARTVMIACCAPADRLLRVYPEILKRSALAFWALVGCVAQSRSNWLGSSSPCVSTPCAFKRSRAFSVHVPRLQLPRTIWE
jgi:hypothetical protein